MYSLIEALVFLLTTPTIGAPPRVGPLPKELVPELVPVLPNGLELPGVDVDVPVVPDVPDESVPLLPALFVEDGVELEDVPPNDDVPPKEDVLPRGFELIPGVPPSTLLPAVPAF